MPIPDNLSVKRMDFELFGGCNYKCRMCPQSIGREKEFLRKQDLSILEKVLDEAVQYGLEEVSLHGNGEPTLHPELPDAIAKVKARGVKCMFTTNGSNLNKDLSRALIEASVDVLRVSAIGYDRETYHHWMSEDLYEQVRESGREFVALNRELGGNTEFTTYHVIIDEKEKDREVELYRQNWIDYTGSTGEIWLMFNWSGMITPPYERGTKVETRVKRSCRRMFTDSLVVRAGGLDGHQGSVMPCCFLLGKDSQGVLGHLDSDSIRDVVAGDKFEELRKAHTEGRFDDIPYCKDCDQLYDEPEALVWTNREGREYLGVKIIQ
jgi:MoaA/NifB/PqqE/SkfB family radical SAM enzyme